MLEQVSEIMAGNAGARKVFLLFNKATGAFYTWASWHENNGFDKSLFNIVELEDFDPETQVILGSWDDWSVGLIAEQPQEVMEEHIDAVTQQAILDEFSLGKQINTASEAIIAIAKATGTTELPEVKALVEQLDQIQLKIEAGNIRKVGYAADDSFNFLTKADLDAAEAARLGGGLFEQAGARQVI